MQYLGSKAKIAKNILPIILKNRQKNQTYVEIFSGGCNSICCVDGPRIANDNNYYLQEMWAALQRGWEPPDNLSKEEYYSIKSDNSAYSPELVGFVAFLCSFGGKEWGGYAANSKGDNYCLRGKRVLLKQIPLLKDVVFTYGDYRDLMIPPNSIIYADPPYKGTTKYKGEGFDYDAFYEWCKKQPSLGHSIFISEYDMPKEFELLLEMPVKTVLDKNTQKPRIERLYTTK